ncbi:MAG: hypothetical protein MUC97_10940 [Bernardetiaceae bacterium]|jgi:hypothetical protein|nr:hypothetical protein [Bernardetiaceae bacterium]
MNPKVFSGTTVGAGLLRALLFYAGVVCIHETLLRSEYETRSLQLAQQAFAQASQMVLARNAPAPGLAVQAVAQRAVQGRNDLKAEIRERGNAITKAWAEQRNLAKYGNPIGPSYDELKASLLKKGTPADSVDWAMINSSGQTNRAVTARVDSFFWYGLALLVIYLVWMALSLRRSGANWLPALGREAITLLLGSGLGYGLSHGLAAWLY